MQADSVFSGISTFGRLPYFPCLASDEERYDIAFLGECFLSCLLSSLSADFRGQLTFISFYGWNRPQVPRSSN